MVEVIKNASAYLQSLPGHDLARLEEAYQAALKAWNTKIVVLDDDPTGVQTVHDIYVYTNWSVETLKEAFLDGNRMFFLLTNSRSLSAEQTTCLHEAIANNLAQVSRELQMDFVLISRGDSTLRGHYPLETEVLRRTLEQAAVCRFDGEVIMPFFPEGGRYTVNDIHYVEEKGSLVPAGMTEFAKDKTFGYVNSHLPAWVEEKTAGSFGKADVCCVSLEELRFGDPEQLTQKLCGVERFGKVIVNAVSYADVKAFTVALCAALLRGKRFLFRTAAALPKILGGVSDQPLLTKQQLCPAEKACGGLVIVGSHVKKTSTQLTELLSLQGLAPIEFNQHLVLEPGKLAEEVNRAVQAAEAAISAGKTAVVYTRRERLDVGGSKEDELRLATQISDAVTSIVEKLQVCPAWILAKGGITSSEIGVKGLQVRRANVMGQALPGVPVWQTGADSRFPGMPYVIFPGNVGSETAVRDLVASLQG